MNTQITPITRKERNRIYISRLRAAANLAETFNEQYVGQLQLETGTFSVLEDHVTYFIQAGESWLSDEQRDIILARAGKVFGRSGWETILNAARTHFDWVKVIDGVTVHVVGAQRVPALPKGTPLSEDRFPLIHAA